MRKEFEEYKKMKVIELEAIKRVEKIKASTGETTQVYGSIFTASKGSFSP